MALSRDKVASIEVAFEQKCFRLIIEAYNGVVRTPTDFSNLMENDISAIFCRNIRANPLSNKWHIFSKTENHLDCDNVEIERGFANKLPRIDFVFCVFHSDKPYEYFIEAKNLKENDLALKKRYIKTGINNFVSAKYKNGSLAGYLLEGKTDNTITGINSLLEKDGRNTELLIAKTHNLHKDYYESEHNTGIIKHLIFDFTKI